MDFLKERCRYDVHFEGGVVFFYTTKQSINFNILPPQKLFLKSPITAASLLWRFRATTVSLTSLISFFYFQYFQLGTVCLLVLIFPGVFWKLSQLLPFLRHLFHKLTSLPIPSSNKILTPYPLQSSQHPLHWLPAYCHLPSESFDTLSN